MIGARIKFIDERLKETPNYRTTTFIGTIVGTMPTPDVFIINWDADPCNRLPRTLKTGEFVVI